MLPWQNFQKAFRAQKSARQSAGLHPNRVLIGSPQYSFSSKILAPKFTPSRRLR
jgi:hypothetical protein